MFTQKPLKSEKESKALCTIFFPHSIQYPPDHLTELFHRPKTIVASVDPGIKNYAIRIAERNNTTRKTSSLYYARWILDQPDKSKDEVELDVTYECLSKKFTSIIDIIEQVDILLVERQLPINYNSNRVMQHTITWFESAFRQNKTGRYPIICLISPTLKGKMFDVPRGLPKPELKKWSTQQTIEILEDNGDEWALQRIQKESKKDDMADVVTQYEAFCIYFGLDQYIYKPPKSVGANKHIKIKIKDGKSTKTATSAS